MCTMDFDARSIARIFAGATGTQAAVETIKMRAWRMPFCPSFITRYSHCLEGSTAVGSQQIKQELSLPLPSKPGGIRTWQPLRPGLESAGETHLQPRADCERREGGHEAVGGPCPL
jgi:hypothetical protein